MTGRAALWTEGGQSQDGIKHQSESEESRTGAWIHQGRATEVFEGCAGGRLPGGWTALWMTLGWGPPEGHSEECNGVACAPVPQSEKHTQSTTFTTKISSHWCHHSVRAAESGANKKNKIDQVIVLTIKVCFSCIRGGPWKSSFYHLHNFFWQYCINNFGKTFSCFSMTMPAPKKYRGQTSVSSVIVWTNWNTDCRQNFITKRLCWNQLGTCVSMGLNPCILFKMWWKACKWRLTTDWCQWFWDHTVT